MDQTNLEEDNFIKLQSTDKRYSVTVKEPSIFITDITDKMRNIKPEVEFFTTEDPQKEADGSYKYSITGKGMVLLNKGASLTGIPRIHIRDNAMIDDPDEKIFKFIWKGTIVILSKNEINNKLTLTAEIKSEGGSSRSEKKINRGKPKKTKVRTARRTLLKKRK